MRSSENIAFYRWVILSITTFTQATISLVSQGIGPLGPFLVTELHLTKAQLGFLGGAVNFGMTFTVFLAGRAVDVWGEKKVLVTGGIATGVSMLFASLTNTFVPLIAFLVLTGLWTATSTPAGSKAIMTWFPFSQRGMALGIRQMGIPLGGVVAALILPPIAAHFGWKMAMLTISAGTIFGSVVCQFTYKDFPHQEENRGSQKSRPWKHLMYNRNIWYTGLSGITYVAVQFIILSYLVLYLNDRIGISVALASLFLAIVQFGGMVGRVFWGYASDTLFRGKRKPVMIIIGGVAAGLSLMMLLVSPATPLWVVGLMAWVFGISSVGWQGVFVTMISEISGKEQAGTAVGIGLTFLQIGIFTIPPIFGFLVDRSGSYTMSWMSLSLLVISGVLILTRVKEGCNASLEDGRNGTA